tara:strand:- start:7092 stop:8789 length:1698 start_codon:yes stop_codon:yes gene_type:complete
MINLLILSFLTVLFHLFVGKNFSKFLGINNNTYFDLSLTSLFGLISLSLISLFINFFLPLNQQTNTIVLVSLILSLLITNPKFLKNYKSKIVINFVIICSLGVFLMILLSKIYTPDAGMYHIPYINILNENKIIIGLSNLHHRYGHISIMQYLSAVHFNYLFGINGIIIPLASLAIYSIFLFLSNINQKKDLSISNIFSILIVIYICWKMNRYSEYGNDAPGHFIFFITVLIYLNAFEISRKINEQTFYIIAFFSIFAFLNKTFLIFSLLVPLICLNKNILKNLINLKFLIVFLFLSFWALKNILTTGCILYPMPSSCFNLSWTNFDGLSNIYEVSIGSEAWSKDWSNQKGNILPYKEFLENFYWLKFWIQNHFIKILEILLPYIIAIIIFIIFIKIMNKRQQDDYKLNFRYYVPIFTVLMIGILAWFLKAPILRYGYSYIVSFIALSSALIISYNLNGLKVLKEKKISKSIIFLAIIIISTKQFVRIYKNFDVNYNNYPWPRYYSETLENRKNNLKKVVKNENFFYFIPRKSYCFYNKSPCTSVEVDKNLKKRINKYGYKTYYF